MEEAVLPFNTMLPTSSDTFMDLDLMDELLLEGCWLETSDRYHGPSTSDAFFDPSIVWPTSENSYDELSGHPSKQSQEERQRSSFPENLSISQSEENESTIRRSICENNGDCVTFLSQSENYSVEKAVLSRTWWIGPRDSFSVMDRLIHAVKYIKDCSRDKNVLIQIWVPVNRGGRRVLITSGQPFLLDHNCPRLVRYRDISENYEFPAEENSNLNVGLPGRVFMGKVPEWTPDVRFFRQEEYPRLGHAQQQDVRGTLAVPVFEQGSCNCLGVIEVVLTTQKINYTPEIDSVCKALEAVDLGTSRVSSPQSVKACDFSYQAALPEILEVLKCACMTHGLPLAQTWAPCVQQGKGGSRHSNENLFQCVSTVDSACYIGDRNMQGFHEACSEHHLLKGQGIPGRAFTTHQPCFSRDVTSYSKTEYPLSHHARVFGLCAAVAVRLRCTYTGSADFVLEFFLPKECRDPEEQRGLLNSLSIIIQKVCRNLRVLTERELQQETTLPLDEVAIPSNMRVRKEMPKVEHIESTQEIFSNQVEVQDNPRGISALQFGKPRGMLDQPSEFMQHQPISSSMGGVVFDKTFSASCERSLVTVGKAGEKRRVKAEKTITLEVLREHFAGSLKDAAKSLGVCPTTLKRICRLHGIKRWPSRKIKKVGHSLQKIQRVIDSVQGASGPLQIESFYSNFPELAIPNFSRTNPFSNDHAKSSYMQPPYSVLSPQAAASLSPSSSCSQNSNSSQCCSTGTQSGPTSKLNVAGHDGVGAREGSGDCELKRVRSDAELLLSDGPKLLPRSQSHMTLTEHPRSQNTYSAFRDSSRKDQGDILRVKVTYGEEKIRLCMQSNWGYKDLLQVITRRFGLDDASGFHLKYLDDDSEWVLLTCEADLEECIDVYRSSHSQTIKLCLLRDPEQHIGSYFGSNCPSQPYR